MESFDNPIMTCSFGWKLGLVMCAGNSPECIMHEMGVLGVNPSILSTDHDKDVINIINRKLEDNYPETHIWFKISFATVIAIGASGMDDLFEEKKKYICNNLRKLGVKTTKRGKLMSLLDAVYLDILDAEKKSSLNSVSVENVINALTDLASEQLKGGNMSKINVEVNNGVIGGAGASFVNTHLDNTTNSIEFNYEEVSNELAELKKVLQNSASEPAHFTQLAAVADAEEAARQKDGERLLGALKKTGEWTLETARKVCVPVAVEAIKKCLALE